MGNGKEISTTKKNKKTHRTPLRALLGAVTRMATATTVHCAVAGESSTAKTHYSAATVALGLKLTATGPVGVFVCVCVCALCVATCVYNFKRPNRVQPRTLARGLQESVGRRGKGG